MLRAKPSITPTANYTAARNGPVPHITSNYKFIGFDILPDYGVFDIFKNPDIARAGRLQAAFGEKLPVSLHHSELILTQSTHTFSRP
jgi:hypothetical protein